MIRSKSDRKEAIWLRVPGCPADGRGKYAQFRVLLQVDVIVLTRFKLSPIRFILVLFRPNEERTETSRKVLVGPPAGSVGAEFVVNDCTSLLLMR